MGSNNVSRNCVMLSSQLICMIIALKICGIAPHKECLLFRWVYFWFRSIRFAMILTPSSANKWTHGSGSPHSFAEESESSDPSSSPLSWAPSSWGTPSLDLFTMFGQCLQGMAATKWSAIITKYPVPDRIADSFVEAQKDYLKKMATINHLGDVIIGQLENTRKLTALSMEDYL